MAARIPPVSTTPTTLVFNVPGPVVPWKRTVSGKDGGRYTPQVQRDYQQHVKSCAWAELASRGWLSTWPTDGRYAVLVEARVPDYAVRDVDNIFKGVADALKSLVWRDDSRVDDARITRVISPEKLGLTVRVDVLVARWGKARKGAA